MAGVGGELALEGEEPGACLHLVSLSSDKVDHVRVEASRVRQDQVPTRPVKPLNLLREYVAHQDVEARRGRRFNRIVDCLQFH